MAPSTPPPEGGIAILNQQGLILSFFVFSCVLMVCAVYLGDRRSSAPGFQARGRRGRSRAKGSGSSSLSETTPLLSPESTLVGSVYEHPDNKPWTTIISCEVAPSEEGDAPSSSQLEARQEGRGSPEEPSSTV
ncbi:hypothetical protein C8A05DRAFT_35738 [Staphylotrichum tortipilum]|uniref:Uncharacterized protein n=1 Tax=Staphylotrichum tortipilum TaxID=2831512 RepID=A0AAN6RS89_9PEZI|nr:hypothetical protein C8A05DRAFT_35738 [Staphylotrichum longicolle]